MYRSLLRSLTTNQSSSFINSPTVSLTFSRPPPGISSACQAQPNLPTIRFIRTRAHIHRQVSHSSITHQTNDKKNFVNIFSIALPPSLYRPMTHRRVSLSCLADGGGGGRGGATIRAFVDDNCLCTPNSLTSVVLIFLSRHPRPRACIKIDPPPTRNSSVLALSRSLTLSRRASSVTLRVRYTRYTHIGQKLLGPRHLVRSYGR